MAKAREDARGPWCFWDHQGALRLLWIHTPIRPPARRQTQV